jgi:hypothetical protein
MFFGFNYIHQIKLSQDKINVILGAKNVPDLTLFPNRRQCPSFLQLTLLQGAIHSKSKI